jgi:hypothetical protein
LLILIAAAYFFFMQTEAAFIDTSSCISEIVEAHLNVLFDFLVVLAIVISAVAPGSPLERQ